MMWLIDVTLRSSVIVLVGLALMPLLRRQSAALRHWVLFTSLLCASAVPAAMWLLPEFEAPVSVGAFAPPVTRRVEALAVPATGTSQQHGEVNAMPVATQSGNAAAVLWLGGTLLSLTALVVGLLRLRRITTRASDVAEHTWLDALASAKADGDAGRAGEVTLKVTDQPGLLIVWGLGRSTILLPAAALAWSQERIDAVLRHELAHIRRGDWFMLIASEVVRALYWFNPIVWIACARLRTESEIACDDIVIADGEPPTEYAEHVLAIARQLRTSPWLPAPAVVRASTLERRVRAMLDKTRNRRVMSSPARITTLAAIAALTMTVAAVAAQSFVSLRGTIVDPTNGVLPGVTLVLTNQQSEAKYEIKTDRTGRYEFVGLPPGDYTMEALLPGFSRFTGRVSVATQNLQQDVTMHVGTIQETITVTSGPSAASPSREVGLSPEGQRKLAARRAQAEAACAAPQTTDGTPIGGNIRVPIKIRDVKPMYPAALVNTEGLVVLHTRIGTSGTVEDIEVASSTHEEFTQAAIEAVRRWEFDATRLNCEAIVTPMRVTINFRIAP